MAKLYIDTNVILDMINNRENLFGESLGKPAGRIFADAVKCRHYLIISDWCLRELYKHIEPASARMFFKIIKPKVISREYSEEDKKKAIELSREYPDDALHVILAEKSKADIIVTSNTEHFNQISTHIPIKKPKHL